GAASGAAAAESAGVGAGGATAITSGGSRRCRWCGPARAAAAGRTPGSVPLRNRYPTGVAGASRHLLVGGWRSVAPGLVLVVAAAAAQAAVQDADQTVG